MCLSIYILDQSSANKEHFKAYGMKSSATSKLSTVRILKDHLYQVKLNLTYMFAEEVELNWNACILFHIMFSSFITFKYLKTVHCLVTEDKIHRAFFVFHNSGSLIVSGFAKRGCCFPCFPKKGMPNEDANERCSSTEWVVKKLSLWSPVIL